MTASAAIDDDAIAEATVALLAKTERWLAGAGFDRHMRTVRELLEQGDDLYVCRARRGFIYDLFRDGDHPSGLWRRLPEGTDPAPDAPWEPVFDIDAHIAQTGRDWMWRGPVDQPGGTRTMLQLSPGDGRLTAREFDLGLKAFVPDGFETPLARQSLAWDGPDRLLAAIAANPADRTRVGLPRTVRAWERGTRLEVAPRIFACEEDDLFVRPWTIPRRDGTLRVFLTQHALGSSTIQAEDGTGRRRLDLPRQSEKLVTDRHVIWQPLAPDDHDCGAVLAAPLDRLDHVRVLFRPSAGLSLSTFMAARGRVVLLGQDRAAPWMAVADLDAVDTCPRAISLPDGISHLDVSWFAVDPDGAGEQDADLRLNVVAQSLLSAPVLLRLNAAGDGPTCCLRAERPSFDASGMTEAMRTALSADGTAVPYRIALPTPTGRPPPMLMTAYGGFGLDVDAGYQRLLGPLILARGIGYAVAHVRGGGELGPHWHGAGRGVNKFRAYEDCAAVAADLVSSGLALPGRVGFHGGSHGGLLGAAMAVFYPQLFAAIWLSSPVTDLLGFDQSGIGLAWREEFGNPSDPIDAKRLREISPLHNVTLARGARVPDVMIETALDDDRVDPLHAVRFAVSLQRAAYTVYLHIENNGGHTGSGTSESIATTTAAMSEFFLSRLLV